MALSGASFRTYVLFSFVLGSVVVGHAAVQKRFFYRTMVYLGESKLAIMAAANIALVSVIMVWKTVQRIFLGPLRFREIERLNTRARDAIIECCFATTIFREEVNLLFLALVTTLLMLKSLHWLAKDRMDFLEEQPLSPRSAHVRLVGLMSLLFAGDFYLVYRCAKTTFRTKGGTMLVLFAFEFTVLLIELCSDFVRYIFHAIDLRLDGRWDSRGLYSFYNELVTDLCQLTVYLAFFLYVHTFYTFPLHILREVYITFTKFQRRCHDFIRYRRVVSTMNERFPDATDEELNAGDRICIICREEMVTAKKLPCGHMFHAHCLQSWLKRQLSSPTCRHSVDVNPPTSSNNAQPNGDANGQPPVGGAVPPPPDDVPQGPGIWDHAYRLWRHIAFGEPREGLPQPPPGAAQAQAQQQQGARPQQPRRHRFWPNLRFGIHVGQRAVVPGAPPLVLPGGLGGRPNENIWPPGGAVPGAGAGGIAPGAIPDAARIQQRLQEIMAAHGVPVNPPLPRFHHIRQPQAQPQTPAPAPAPMPPRVPGQPPIEQLIQIQESLTAVRNQLDGLRDHVQALLVQATEQTAVINNLPPTAFPNATVTTAASVSSPGPSNGVAAGNTANQGASAGAGSAAAHADANQGRDENSM